MRPTSLLLPLLACAAWGQAPAKPRIALVIDDFGLTYPKNVPDEEWMALPFPMTFAVMPASPRTRQAAEAAKKAGKELVIHFPFDPFLSLGLDPKEVSEEDKGKVLKLLEDSFKTIPGAVGLNNHRSHKATQNRPLMAWFMGDLKARGGLYFIDSRVSPKSAAYDEARRAGLKAATNSVFLDEAKTHDKAFCLRMLDRAASIAKRRGRAVAIGHHYFRGTYECLKEGVPRLQEAGYEFVAASGIVR